MTHVHEEPNPADQSAADTDDIAASAPVPAVAPPPLSGRSAFAVQTIAGGVSVRPIFMTDTQQLLQTDAAVFPNLPYALAQVDALRVAILEHFNRAAMIGSQVLAQQTQAVASVGVELSDEMSAAASDAPSAVH